MNSLPMMQSLSLPIQDPIAIFALVLFIILFTNSVLRKTHIPSIIGLIMAGVIVGPHGLNLLQRDGGIILFGTVGFLYIMFLAGLDIRLHEFKRRSGRSLLFGLTTFAIPMAIGIVTGVYVFSVSLAAAVLLGSMFASHTLIAYPIASKMGITRSEIVSVTVGGTIITNTLALLVLAVVVDGTQGDLDNAFWWRLVVSFLVFLFCVLVLIPKIGAWYFKRSDQDGALQYIFILTMVYLAAVLSQVIGIEPIIGAFFAGLALNTLVPLNSPLMNRIEFTGNTLFIPFFLLGVGMLVDLRLLFSDWQSIVIGTVMTGMATAGKWLPAWLTQKLVRYTVVERNILFGLSNAQAAATLAVVSIGYDIGLFNEYILNGTIMMILATCFISSCVVQSAAVRLAVQESDKAPEVGDVHQRILVPIANPLNIEHLLDLAMMIKDPKSLEPVFPLVVIMDNDRTKEEILRSHKNLEKAVKYTAAAETSVRVVSRVDTQVAKGIARAAKELIATEVIIGWNGESPGAGNVLGKVLDTIVENTQETVLISKILSPLNVIKNLRILVPHRAHVEVGFTEWIALLKGFADRCKARLTFQGNPLVLAKISETLHKIPPVGDVATEEAPGLLSQTLPEAIPDDELLIVIGARKNMESFEENLEQVPGLVAARFENRNFIILYPRT